MVLAEVTGVKHYTHRHQGSSRINLHSAFDHPHHLWGFQPANVLGATARAAPHEHLGGIIVATRGTHPDHLQEHTCRATAASFPWTSPSRGPTRPRTAPRSISTAGFIPWISDGGPFDWLTLIGHTHGLSFLNNPVLNPAAPCTGEAEYYYPNEPERPADVVPRPRLRHHPHQRLRRHRQRPASSGTAFEEEPGQ